MSLCVCKLKYWMCVSKLHEIRKPCGILILPMSIRNVNADDFQNAQINVWIEGVCCLGMAFLG